MIPKKVYIFGGTHGNEWTGAILVTKYEEHFKKKFPHLNLEFVLANPRAFKENRRFTEEDLNRAFQYLNDNRSSYELELAREISKKLEDEKCLIIDLHTTTSNLGLTLIITEINDFNLSLCSLVQDQVPDCKIILSPDPEKKYLVRQSPFGLMVEVGPVANGVINAEILYKMKHLIECILDSIELDPIRNSALTVFEEVQDVYYPHDEQGSLNACIHSVLEGKDFAPMKGEIAVFKDFNGRDICINLEEELYPIFINEAAYYPKGLAFTLCRKKVINLR